MNNNRSLLVLFFQLLQTLFSVVSLILISRGLTVELFGNYIYVVTICSLLALFSGGGTEHVFLMNGSKDITQIDILFSNSILFRTLLNLIIFAFSILLNLLTNFKFWDYTLFLYGYCIVAYVNPLFISYYRVKGDFIKPWILSFLGPCLFLLYLIIFRNFNTLFKLGLAFLISNTTMCLFFIFDLRKLIKFKFDLISLFKNIKICFVFMTSQLFDFIFLRIDIFIVKMTLGPYFLGIYAVAQRLVSFLQVIPSSFHIVELPTFHRLSENIDDLNSRFIKLKSLLFLLGLIFFGILCLNANWLINILFSNKYISSKKIVYILSIAGIINFVSYPYYMLAEALNKINQRLYIRICTLFFTIILMLVLNLKFNIIGASISILVGNFLFVIALHKLTHNDFAIFRTSKKDLIFFLLICTVFLISFTIVTAYPESLFLLIVSNLIFITLVLFIITKKLDFFSIDKINIF
jgi:O-antigen/teichoic acid export membrane protein